MGCEVVGVGTNVAQALQFANPDKIDLAIIDYVLDDGTCERLIDALVAQSIPFVICTGFAPEEIEASYRGVPILRKPFDADVDLLMTSARPAAESSSCFVFDCFQCQAIR